MIIPKFQLNSMALTIGLKFGLLLETEVIDHLI